LTEQSPKNTVERSTRHLEI